MLLVAHTAACSRCERSQAETAAPAVSVAEVPRAPIPAPPSLIARLRVAAPDALWRRVQSSPRLNLLPHRFALAVSTLLGLSPHAGAEIDERLAVHGLLLQQDGKLNLVVAVGLKSGSAFLATVTTGNTGYRAQKDPVTGFAEILSESPDEGLRRGVYGNHLVIGSRAAALGSLAPYLVREVPGQTWPESELALVADARGLELLAASLRTSFDDLVREMRASADEMRRRMGRAADYGDPEVVLETLSALSSAAPRLLGTMSEGVVTADGAPHGWDIGLRVAPTRGSESEAFVQGLAAVNYALVTELPRRTDLAFAMDAPFASRQGWSEVLAEKATRAFGPRLAEKDHAALRAGLLYWDKARGDQAAWGWSSDPLGLVLLTELEPDADPEKTLKALAVALRGPLGAGRFGEDFGTITVRPKAFVLAPGSEPSKVPASAPTRAKLEAEVLPGTKKPRHQPRALSVEWQLGEASAAEASSGEAGTRVLRAVLAERSSELMQSWSTERLKDEPDVAQALEKLERPSAVLFVHRRALKGFFGISASSPLVVTLGAMDGALRIRIRADVEVVSALAGSGAR